MVSIHGPLGYELNTLTSAPLCWLQMSDQAVFRVFCEVCVACPSGAESKCSPARQCSAALRLAGPKMAAGPEVPGRWGAAAAGAGSGAAVKTEVVAPARPRFDSGSGAMGLPRRHSAGGATACTARTEFSEGKTVRCVWGLQI